MVDCLILGTCKVLDCLMDFLKPPFKPRTELRRDLDVEFKSLLARLCLTYEKIK